MEKWNIYRTLDGNALTVQRSMGKKMHSLSEMQRKMRHKEYDIPIPKIGFGFMLEKSV